MYSAICTSKNFGKCNMFQTFQQEIGGCAFVYQIEFDKTRWSCSWNSDENCIT